MLLALGIPANSRFFYGTFPSRFLLHLVFALLSFSITPCHSSKITKKPALHFIIREWPCLNVRNFRQRSTPSGWFLKGWVCSSSFRGTNRFEPLITQY